LISDTSLLFYSPQYSSSLARFFSFSASISKIGISLVDEIFGNGFTFHLFLISCIDSDLSQTAKKDGYSSKTLGQNYLLWLKFFSLFFEDFFMVI